MYLNAQKKEVGKGEEGRRVEDLGKRRKLTEIRKKRQKAGGGERKGGKRLLRTWGMTGSRSEVGRLS